uniref:LOB domain-containing protein n=1 Tax=Kalanchoe fedtschenkoi TaxID=63787 RepID=A0A7N0V2R1_KALFE
MEHRERTSTTPSPTSSLTSSPPSSPSQATTTVIMSPCAACKILRRRCADKCVLAPYFPPTEPHKFTIAHRVFGASNIIKFLQELPEAQRADAVSSMVYEASARIRDPVYGCAGAICQLQKQVSELQAQLAKSQAEIVNMQAQQAQLVALICMEMSSVQPSKTTVKTAPDQSFDCEGFIGSPLVDDFYGGLGFEIESDGMGSLGWETPLWPDVMMTS